MQGTRWKNRISIGSTMPAIQLAFLLFVGFVKEYSAQDFSSCQRTYNVPTNGSTITIRSGGYPAAYPRGQNCQINYVAPYGYQVNTFCTCTIPGTTNCAGDRLDVSRAGSGIVNEDQRFCGSRNFTTTSITNRMTISQLSSGNQATGNWACTSWATPGCNCGTSRSTRIVGGTASQVCADPSMAALIDRQTGLVCGCTLIAPNKVLTAAHCVDQSRISNYVVRTGDTNLYTANESPEAADYPVISATVHEGYNPNNGANDIAILTVPNVRYGQCVGAACLPWQFQNYDFANQQVTGYGYGATTFGGQASNTLNQGDFTLISNDQCNANPPDPDLFIAPSQACSYSPGSDFCQYDSGGGFKYRYPYDGRTYVVCIMSYGRACGLDIPSVCTRVTSFLPWIQANTPDAQYCY